MYDLGIAWIDIILISFKYISKIEGLDCCLQAGFVLDLNRVYRTSERGCVPEMISIRVRVKGVTE